MQNAKICQISACALQLVLTPQRADLFCHLSRYTLYTLLFLC